MSLTPSDKKNAPYNGPYKGDSPVDAAPSSIVQEEMFPPLRPRVSFPRAPTPVAGAPSSSPCDTEMASTDSGSRLLISDLCHMAEWYMEPEDVQKIYQAYLFGAEAHDGQHRSSGEPYIYHPLSVASILIEMHMDCPSIVAAILHDVIEDTEASKPQIAERFGEQVAEIVDGVSKLTEVKFQSKAEAQAENFRKMLMAMVQDIRVIIIKLADRLHNMRTLGALRRDKRRRIARETLDIYAPIATRLGMNVLRLELEDLCFKAMYPDRYRVLCQSVRKARGNRKQILQKIEVSINRAMNQEDMEAEVFCREKHIYSIYKKMLTKRLHFGEVSDVYAVRLIVDRVDMCYRALGAMHNLYKPVPGKFKDYIAIPKANGYQSLHTVLFGPHGLHMEVQIRTRDMDHMAESGIAAHWLYKTPDEDSAANTGGVQTRTREWLRELLDMQRSAGNSEEFLESVKVDLFPDEVYVFSPAGDIMELPRGATVVDFAYAVHSELGHSCVSAKVNQRAAPLGAELHNGDVVEVETIKGQHPSPSWLNFVVTAKARSNIRHYLKQLAGDEASGLGRRLLDNALARYSLELDALPDSCMQWALDQFQLDTVEQLLQDIGCGNRPSELVARRLADASDVDMEFADAFGDDSNRPLSIKGTEGLFVQFARCCHPVPGDAVIGFLSAEKGLVIHRNGCANARDTDGNEKWLEVEWAEYPEGEFQVEIRIDVANQRGVLAGVATTISDADSNIENVEVEDRDGKMSRLIFQITVRDRSHLAQVMRVVRKTRAVMHINRT